MRLSSNARSRRVRAERSFLEGTARLLACTRDGGRDLFACAAAADEGVDLSLGWLVAALDLRDERVEQRLSGNAHEA